MPNVVPNRDVQVGGRNFIAGSLYSVDEATVDAILASESDEPEAEAEVVEIEAEEADEGPPTTHALKAEWVEYAVSQGMARVDAEAATKDELIAQFGAHQ